MPMSDIVVPVVHLGVEEKVLVQFVVTFSSLNLLFVVAFGAYPVWQRCMATKAAHGDKDAQMGA